MENRDPDRYFLEVDQTNQVVTAYEKDEKGEFTKIARQMICSTGVQEKPTPTGTYKMGSMKERFGYFVFFNVWAQYWSQVVRGVYFHSILYSRKDPKTLQWHSYRNLGRRASHGCIRLLVEDARWIYYNCPAGTEIHLFFGERNRELTKSLLPPPRDQYDPGEDPNPDPIYAKAFVKTKYATLRTGFGKDDYAIKSLPKGTEVEVIQYGIPHMKVSDGRRLGYVKATEIAMSEFEMTHTAAIDKTAYVTAKVPTGIYQRNRLRGDPLGTLNIGDEAVVLERGRTVHKIKLGAVEGYVKISDIDLYEKHSGKYGAVKGENARIYNSPGIGVSSEFPDDGERLEILKEADANGYLQVVYNFNPMYINIRDFVPDDPNEKIFVRAN